MVNQENIPDGIVGEIKEHFPVIDFSNYGGVLKEGVVSRKLLYKEDINGYHMMTYIVLAQFINDTAMIYGVYDSGIVSGE